MNYFQRNIFAPNYIQYFRCSRIFFTFATKKSMVYTFFFKIPNERCNVHVYKVIGIPLPSVSGMHLISRIVHHRANNDKGIRKYSLKVTTEVKVYLVK